jgi:hypothetical protein|nr:MAG TPA: hypothetical protein [Caudoviricetes sp.]
MPNIAINIQGQALTAMPDKPLVSRSVGEVTCTVTLDDSWAGYTVTLVFAADKVQKSALVPSNGVLTVPWEVLDRPGCLRISAVGHAPGKRRPTAIMQQPLVIAANGRIEGTPPQEYTPALWEQMMARLEETSGTAGKSLRLIYRGKLLRPVSAISISHGADGNPIALRELYTQAYIPGNPDLSPTRLTSIGVVVALIMPDGSTLVRNGCSFGRAHPDGFVFSREKMNFLTGECTSSSVHVSDALMSLPYSMNTSHYYGQVELDALKDIDAFAYTCVDSGGQISRITISAGFRNESVEGTEILIRGK